MSRLQEVIEKGLAGASTAISKCQQAILENPMHGILWHGESLMLACHKQDLYRDLLEVVKSNGDVAGVLASQVLYVLRNCEGRSSSPMSNLSLACQRIATAEINAQLQPILKHAPKEP